MRRQRLTALLLPAMIAMFMAVITSATAPGKPERSPQTYTLRESPYGTTLSWSGVLVDIICFENKVPRSEFVLQRIQVVKADDKNGPETDITLLVTPTEAELLDAAGRCGTLHVTLSPPESRRVSYILGITGDEIRREIMLRNQAATDTSDRLP